MLKFFKKINLQPSFHSLQLAEFFRMTATRLRAMHTTLTQRSYQWIINGYVQHARIVNSILNATVAIIHTYTSFM